MLHHYSLLVTRASVEPVYDRNLYQNQRLPRQARAALDSQTRTVNFLSQSAIWIDPI